MNFPFGRGPISRDRRENVSEADVRSAAAWLERRGAQHDRYRRVAPSRTELTVLASEPVAEAPAFLRTKISLTASEPFAVERVDTAILAVSAPISLRPLVGGVRTVTTEV